MRAAARISGGLKWSRPNVEGAEERAPSSSRSDRSGPDQIKASTARSQTGPIMLSGNHPLMNASQQGLFGSDARLRIIDWTSTRRREVHCFRA